MSKLKHLVWKIKKNKILHTTAWMKLHEDVLDVGGVKVTYTYVEKVGDGPIVVAVYQNKLLLVKQYRHPIRKSIWQFAAEHCDFQETQKEAALRCVSEELGFECGKLSLLGSLYTDPGLSTQKSNFYLAESLKPLENSHSEPIEDIEIGQFSLEEIEGLIEKGEIVDNWTLSALALYERHLNQI